MSIVHDNESIADQCDERLHLEAADVVERDCIVVVWQDVLGGHAEADCGVTGLWRCGTGAPLPGGNNRKAKLAGMAGARSRTRR